MESSSFVLNIYIQYKDINDKVMTLLKLRIFLKMHNLRYRMKIDGNFFEVLQYGIK